MSNISIKIVDIHQPSNSVIVKFASEQSAKSIDEYDGVSFQLSNFTATTPDEFIKQITPYISKLVATRDFTEKPRSDIDLTSWHGFSTTVQATEQIDPATAAQLIVGLTSPEVTL